MIADAETVINQLILRLVAFHESVRIVQVIHIILVAWFAANFLIAESGCRERWQACRMGTCT